MATQQEHHVFKGMQRDLTVSQFSPEYYYEARNIRITAREHDTLMAVTNEKGNKEMPVYERYKGNLRSMELKGEPLGHCTIGTTLVLFTLETGGEICHIYKLEYSDIDGGQFIGKDLLSTEERNGLNLNFRLTNPIEAFGVYESDKLQKVYWVDGLNQPRCINISDEDNSDWNNTTFDFSPIVKLTDIMEVKTEENASGLFSPGVVQYAFTYLREYGVETPVISTSGLMYISYPDRGGSPEDKISVGFSITLSNLDTNYDKIRLYSVHRSSINGTPEVKRLADLGIPKSGKLYYLDNNLTGDTIDATELLYKGGEDIVAGTMTNKDQVLFLGNIKINRPIIPNDLKQSLLFTPVSFTSTKTTISSKDYSGFYYYKSSLSLGADKIKHFKRREWYRIGIQFQYKNGQWSEVVFLKDIKLDEKYLVDDFIVNRKGEYEWHYYPQAKVSTSVLEMLYAKGYRRARLAVVYPSESERSVICQGMLCPTVFNIQDRYSGKCFSQSSWFARPFPAFDINSVADTSNVLMEPKYIFGRDEAFTQDDVRDIFNTRQYYRDAGHSRRRGDNHYTQLGNTVNKGDLLEYRHFKALPDCLHRNCEIQCNCFPVPIDQILTQEVYIPDTCAIRYDYDKTKLSQIVEHSKDMFMVDSSIVTLHSPEIEFNDSVQNMESDNLRLRIVGIINLTSFNSDFSLQASTPPFARSPQEGHGYYNEFVGVENLSLQGGGVRGAAINWIDSFYGDTNTNDGGEGSESRNFNILGYFVYPWHANRSLINQVETKSLDCDQGQYNGTKIAVLEKKKLSNMRYSAFNCMLNKAYEFEAGTKGDPRFQTGISGVRIWNSKEVDIIRVPAPKYSGISDFVYSGNVDKIIYPDMFNYEVQILRDIPKRTGIMRNNKVGGGSDQYDLATYTYQKRNGYPIMIGNNNTDRVDYHNTFVGDPVPMVPDWSVVKDWCDGLRWDLNTHGTEPVRMKYKSTPHAVMALNYTNESSGWTTHRCSILPATYYYRGGKMLRNMSFNQTFDDKGQFFWNIKEKAVWGEFDITGIYQGAIPSDSYYSCQDKRAGVYPLLGYSYLFLGELYRADSDVQNRFGGNSEEAYQGNTWYPMPEKIELKARYGSREQTVTLGATVGDTFYMRYDCLKTYPSTLEDQNSIVDIISFKCETRVNLDGRYDKNRGQMNNLVMTPEIFNKMNPVYDQPDNFWTYRGLDTTKIQLDTFISGITWTKDKIPNSFTDDWMQILPANMQYLKGELGAITSLKTFNNEIYCLQEHGLSHILYNARVQIPASDGVPIEMSNGMKMGGYVYLSEKIGSNNKWSTAVASSGIYFIDNSTNAIYKCNGQQIDNISDRLGFRQWTESKSSQYTWDPYYWKNFITFYDRNNNDLYFNLADTSLCFSEPIGQFTSFMDYREVPSMFNLGDGFFSAKRFFVNKLATTRLWKQFEGDYNTFFGEKYPYSITFISNAIPTADKIFNVLEFRADSWYGSSNLSRTFDTLEVWNEYQRGFSHLSDRNGFPSSLKRKFRVWRALIPRDYNNNRDRIRNTWAFIKLSKNNPDTDRTELHDATVHYFV